MWLRQTLINNNSQLQSHVKQNHVGLTKHSNTIFDIGVWNTSNFFMHILMGCHKIKNIGRAHHFRLNYVNYSVVWNKTMWDVVLLAHTMNTGMNWLCNLSQWEDNWMKHSDVQFPYKNSNILMNNTSNLVPVNYLFLS